MTCWGSFTTDAYQKFSNGVVDPMNEMVIAPALRSRAAQAPTSFLMDEYEDEGDEYEDGEEEYENEDTNASMAMGQLRAMAEDIMLILSELSEGEEIEPWVAAKITMSNQSLSAVSDYLRFSNDYSEEFDFARCMRPNGTYYGTRGKCRKGTEAGDKPAPTPKAPIAAKPPKAAKATPTKKGKSGSAGSGTDDVDPKRYFADKEAKDRALAAKFEAKAKEAQKTGRKAKFTDEESEAALRVARTDDMRAGRSSGGGSKPKPKPKAASTPAAGATLNEAQIRERAKQMGASPEKTEELVRVSQMSPQERSKYVAQKEQERKAQQTPMQRAQEQSRNRQEVGYRSGETGKNDENKRRLGLSAKQRAKEEKEAREQEGYYQGKGRASTEKDDVESLRQAMAADKGKP